MILSIVVYLVAVVAANLIIASFGPSAAIPVAFVFIGLDLTLRDRLHDGFLARWGRRGLIVGLGLLIGAGGLLSWILNRDAGQIAVASTVAFVLAAAADSIVYGILERRGWELRANASNLAGAAVDSFVFPALAFGFPLLWGIMLAQFAAKVVGGFVWTLVLRRR